MTAPAPRHLNLAGRIVWRIEKDANGCWLWQGAKDKGGYACMVYDKKSLKVHRASYEVFVGPVPKGLQLDHLCRVRHCVNPDHLEPVTGYVNVHRSPIHHWAKTTCPYGHPYTAENIYPRAGRRACQTCRAINNSIRPYDPEKARTARLASAPDPAEVRAVLQRTPANLGRINEARRILGKAPLRSTA